MSAQEAHSLRAFRGSAPLRRVDDERRPGVLQLSPSLPRLGPIAAGLGEVGWIRIRCGSPSLPRLGPIAAFPLALLSSIQPYESPSLPRLGPIAAVNSSLRLASSLPR